MYVSSNGQASALGQAAWVTLVVATACVAFTWGAVPWMGISTSVFGGPVTSSCTGIEQCLFMGTFGFLCFFFYPASLFVMFMALRRSVRVESDIFHRVYVLASLAFLLSAARLTEAHWSAAMR